MKLSSSLLALNFLTKTLHVVSPMCAIGVGSVNNTTISIVVLLTDPTSIVYIHTMGMAHFRPCATCPAHVILLDLITQIMCDEKHEPEIFKFGQFVLWISVYCFKSNYTLNSVLLKNTFKAVNYFQFIKFFTS